MAIEQTPLAPRRSAAAHVSIATIYEFLGKYNRWLAELGPRRATSHSGNPRTLPLPASWTRSGRDVPHPGGSLNNEPSRRPATWSVRPLAHLTGLNFPPETFHDERRHGALVVTMTALTEGGDE